MTRGRSTRPGIRQVAAEAGVSITTVSDSLSGKGRISEATRRRVREVANSLGYRPDALAQGLRAGHSRLLGLVVTKYGESAWTFTRFPYFSIVVDAAVTAALEDGYALVVLPSDSDLESLLAYPFDGLFVVDPLRRDTVVTEARRRGVYVVADRANASQPDHLWVDFDHDHAITLMCDHLGASGSRTPALLASDGDDSYTHACCAAYERWCEGRGRAPRIVHVDHSSEDAATTVRDLLDGRGRPDAVFGLEDHHLELLQSATRAAGLRVPADVGLGCFAEAGTSGNPEPPIARLSVSPESLAVKAITRLVDAIERRDPRVESTVVDCVLHT